MTWATAHARQRYRERISATEPDEAAWRQAVLDITDTVDDTRREAMLKTKEDRSEQWYVRIGVIWAVVVYDSRRAQIVTVLERTQSVPR